MQHVAKSPATVNADFATAIILRAADIVDSAVAAGQGDKTNAFEALQEARDKFMAGHLHKHERERTYGWHRLINDLREHLKRRGIITQDAWNGITRWSMETPTATRWHEP